MNSLQSICANEQHIAALNQQTADNATVLLTAAGSELWSAAATALQAINANGFAPTDANYTAVLADLDATLTVTK